MKPCLKRLSCAGLALLASACGTLPTPTTPTLGAAVPGPLRECAALVTSFRFDHTRIDSAAPVSAGAVKQGSVPVPAHCLVKGSMHQRTGADGQAYAIAFEMRLPQEWSGRFYYQGNGGLDGNVREALGTNGGGAITGALVQGFAVISADAGHTGRQTPVFGLEPQARLDYGYQAVGKLTPMAKGLIQAAYGKGPDRSYIGGCSNGGRHTMVAAARYGDQYDGYLVGAPGYRLPNAAAAQLWGAQQWLPLATPGATVKHPMNPAANLPDLGSAFTSTERSLLGKAILEKCDRLDGLQDGMVQATQACQTRFNVHTDVPTCQGARQGNCLSGAQKQAVDNVFSGGKTATGQPIYAAFAYDPGVAGDNWATWKFVNALALDPLAIGTVFSVPPGKVDALTDNVSARLALFAATNDVYQESGLALMTPPGHENPTNLASLRARGAKIVLYHGVSDPIFSAEDTRQWLMRLGKAQGGSAANFARYFPVPGMNHCSGSPAADQFDLLAPLVQWVEHGVAPQAVTATARGAGNAGGANAELPGDWSASRTRPLCAYPAVATYQGSGNPEDAASFACR